MENEEEIEFSEPNFEKSIEISREIQSLIKHPGWKYVSDLMVKIGNPNRLKVSSSILSRPDIDSQKLFVSNAFISGEISAVDKINRLINTKVSMGKIFEKKLNPVTPAEGDKGLQN